MNSKMYSDMIEGYFPFKGRTAWFSASVEFSYKNYWEKYGGRYANEFTAEYVFSKDAAAKDTFTIHRDQPRVSIFKPDWIVAVIKKKTDEVTSVPIGQYFLPPFSPPSQKLKTTDEVLLPVVPEVTILKPPEQQEAEKLEFLHIDQLPTPKGHVFEFIAKQNGCAVKKRESKNNKGH